MTRSARPTTAADAPSIVALFDEAGLRPNVEPRDLQWKYWLPRGDWPGARSYVLMDGDAVIAHGAIIPGWCRWGTQRIRIVHLIDWAAHARAAGAGVALMKHVGQQFQALLAIGGSTETQRILPHIGFRSAGVATGYVRTLFPLRLLRSHEIPLWRRLPRFARSVAWMLGAPAARSANWQVRRIAAGDVGRIAAVLPRPLPGMAVIERSVELIRYMLTCPVLPLALFGVERSGAFRGYFLLASAPGQVRIADCWMDSQQPADWRAMILCAVEQAKQDRQAAEVVIWANDPVLSEALRSCGFHARHELAVLLRPANAAAMPPVPLRVQMLDSDAAFFNEGRSEYWA